MCSLLSKSLKFSPWGVDPDYIQVAEVDTLFIIPVVTGAAFSPGRPGMCSQRWLILLLCKGESTA